jgi:hypothetical protein
VRRATAKIIEVPGWAYIFAVACAMIPVVTLGGFIPALVGLGGASACVKVSSSGSIPGVLRVLCCLGITLGCWLVLAALIGSIMPVTKQR